VRSKLESHLINIVLCQYNLLNAALQCFPTLVAMAGYFRTPKKGQSDQLAAAKDKPPNRCTSNDTTSVPKKNTQVPNVAKPQQATPLT
jgi:hypothetical protein